MNNPQMNQLFSNLIALQNQCDNAFAVFNELLENHKQQALEARNNLTPQELFGKKYFMNRPYKWGEIENLKLDFVETDNRHLFTEINGQLKILPYYKHLEAYDTEGIANFIGQFQEFSHLQRDNPEFFSQNSQFLVLWAEDMDFEMEESNIFNHPHFIYEYVVFKL